jgi:hypothetical protein
MKKTYATPVAVAAGDAVRETKSGSPPPEVGTGGFLSGPGSVGFHL